MHERICTSCSERVSKCVRWCSQHWSNVHPCTCMVLTTPVENACILSAKNAYVLVHARICNSAKDSLPWKLLRTYPESQACASIVQAVVCRLLLLPVLLSRPNPSPDAVRSRNPSKSTLTHDAVAAVVLHKHHSIICVGAVLIQFVYGSHSRLAADFMPNKVLFSPWFSRAFLTHYFLYGSGLFSLCFKHCNFMQTGTKFSRNEQRQNLDPILIRKLKD